MENETPRSDHFIAEEWPRFADEVERRLRAGCKVYGDSSFTRTLDSLITEIQAELLDVSGWAAIQWVKLEGQREKIKKLER